MESTVGKCQKSSHFQNKLNVEKMKTEYTNALAQMCLNQSSDQQPYLISMTSKQDLIKNIWKEGIKSNNDKSYTNIYDGKLKVVTHGGMFNIKVKHKDIYKLMIPYERLFDTVWPIHLRHDHDIPDDIIEIIQNKYFIPVEAIHAIKEHCYICKTHYTQIVAQPYYCCHLDLIAMDSLDHSFKAIMVCQDLHTDFIHLRPITCRNTGEQICLELFKIFMDFGPPKQLNISSPILEFAITKLKQLTASTPFDIQLVRKERREKEVLHIKALLQKWSEDSKSNNWAIGCYALQHQLNSEIQGNRQSAAFENVFAYNTSLKNIAKYNESDTESDITNEKLDATLDGSNSKSDESKEGSTTILDDDSSKSGSKEEPVMMLVDNSSKFVESIEDPVDTLEDGAVKDLVIILDDNSSMHVTEKEKLDAVLVDGNSNCGRLAEELNDIPQNLTEKQDMISILSSDGSNCVNFEDEPDDVSDSEYPKCISIQIEDSDDMFDDEDSKCIEFTEPSIMLKDDNAKSSELEKESDVVLEENVPKSAGLQERPDDILKDDAPKCIEMHSDSVTRFDGIFKSGEQTEKKSDAILNENDIESLICVEMHSESEPTLSDNVPKCLEMPTKQVMRMDGDIPKSDEQTKESDSLLDDYDPKRTEIQTEQIFILPDTILKHDELTKQPDAILTADFIKCHELMEVEPEVILGDKDPKCVEMKTDSNVTLDDDGELKDKLDVIIDDSECHEVEAEPEIRKSDRDLNCVETNTKLNDDILKHGEVTNECNVILNNDDPNFDKMDVDSGAIISDKDPKCIEMQTNIALNDILKHDAVAKELNLILNNEEPDLDKMDEDSDAILTDKDLKCVQTESNATLEDDTSKQSKLTEEPNMILDDDHDKVAVMEADDLEIDEPKEEVHDTLKVDSSKPTEFDGGPSITTKLDSPKPSTSGLTSNVDYDSDDSDIVIVSEDPLA